MVRQSWRTCSFDLLILPVVLVLDASLLAVGVEVGHVKDFPRPSGVFSPLMCEKSLTVKQLNQPPAGDRIRRELPPYRCSAAACAELKPECQQVVGAWRRLEEQLDDTPPSSDPSRAEPASQPGVNAALWRALASVRRRHPKDSRVMTHCEVFLPFRGSPEQSDLNNHPP